MSHGCGGGEGPDVGVVEELEEFCLDGLGKVVPRMGAEGWWCGSELV